MNALVSLPAHHALGASSAHRWMHCPGSVAATAGIEEPDSPYAEEGTRAHEEAARCLTSEPPELLYQWDFDDITAIGDYVDRCRTLPGTHHVETKLSLAPWIPGGYGTCDFAAMHDTTLTIRDLKFGKGKMVYAKDNEQLMLYALGALKAFDFLYDIKDIVMEIDQPRRDHVDSHSMSVEALLHWANTEVSAAAAKAMQKNAPRIPGDKQCTWCKVKGTCPELADKVIEAVTVNFDTADCLTLSEMADFIDIARAWCSALEARMMDELLTGKAVPGWKLVDGRSTRYWRDEEDAKVLLVGQLGEAAYAPAKLLSAAQAETAIGKAKFAKLTAGVRLGANGQPEDFNYIAKTDPKPTLARESSGKQAITTNVTQGFENV